MLNLCEICISKVGGGSLRLDVLRLFVCDFCVKMDIVPILPLEVEQLNAA